MDKLEERKKKAEGILQICTRVRSLETEEEKVLPFYVETVTQEEIAAVEAEAGAPPGDPTDGACVHVCVCVCVCVCMCVCVVAVVCGVVGCVWSQACVCVCVYDLPFCVLLTSHFDSGFHLTFSCDHALVPTAIAGAAAGGDKSSQDEGESAVATTRDGERVTEFHMLDNFWKRFNKAALDKAAVEKEQADLEEENLKLRSLLKQYVARIVDCVRDGSAAD